MRLSRHGPCEEPWRRRHPRSSLDISSIYVLCAETSPIGWLRSVRPHRKLMSFACHQVPPQMSRILRTTSMASVYFNGRTETTERYLKHHSSLVACLDKSYSTNLVRCLFVDITSQTSRCIQSLVFSACCRSSFIKPSLHLPVIKNAPLTLM